MPITTSVVVKIMSRTASAVCMILVVMRARKLVGVERHALAQHQAVEVPAQAQRKVDGQHWCLMLVCQATSNHGRQQQRGDADLRRFAFSHSARRRGGGDPVHHHAQHRQNNKAS